MYKYLSLCMGAGACTCTWTCRCPCMCLCACLCACTGPWAGLKAHRRFRAKVTLWAQATGSFMLLRALHLGVSENWGPYFGVLLSGIPLLEVNTRVPDLWALRCTMYYIPSTIYIYTYICSIYLYIIYAILGPLILRNSHVDSKPAYINPKGTSNPLQGMEPSETSLGTVVRPTLISPTSP